jgi:hypothetical protein
MEIKFAPEFEKSMDRMFSNRLIYLIPRTIKDKWYQVKWAWQRVFRGYDDRFCFEFCGMFPDLIIGVCDSMIQYGMGHPSKLKSMKQWHSILNKIKKGFIEYQKIDEMLLDQKQLKKAQKELDKSLDLFKEFYGNLWD